MKDIDIDDLEARQHNAIALATDQASPAKADATADEVLLLIADVRHPTQRMTDLTRKIASEIRVCLELSRMSGDTATLEALTKLFYWVLKVGAG